MESNLVQTIFKTGHIFKRSRKTQQYNKYSKQFQIFNQKSLQKRICSRILQEKGSNNLLNIIFTQKLGKATYTERKKVECFLIINKFVFFSSIQILWKTFLFFVFLLSKLFKSNFANTCMSSNKLPSIFDHNPFIHWMCIKFSKKNIRKLSELQIKYQFQKCCSRNI